MSTPNKNGKITTIVNPFCLVLLKLENRQVSSHWTATAQAQSYLKHQQTVGKDIAC
jgi:hypothetical protein